MSWFYCRKDWVKVHSNHSGTAIPLCIKEPERSRDSSLGSHKPSAVLKTGICPWPNIRVTPRGRLGSVGDHITTLPLSTEPSDVTTWEHLPSACLAWKQKPKPWWGFYPYPFFLPLVGSRTQPPKTSVVGIRLRPPLGVGGSRYPGCLWGRAHLQCSLPGEGPAGKQCLFKARKQAAG